MMKNEPSEKFLIRISILKWSKNFHLKSSVRFSFFLTGAHNTRQSLEQIEENT